MNSHEHMRVAPELQAAINRHYKAVMSNRKANFEARYYHLTRLMESDNWIQESIHRRERDQILNEIEYQIKARIRAEYKI